MVLRRRDRGAGAQGAWPQGPVQELHVGADDTGLWRHKGTGPPIRLFGYSPSRSTRCGDDAVRRAARRRRVDDRRLRALRQDREGAPAGALGMLGACQALLRWTRCRRCPRTSAGPSNLPRSSSSSSASCTRSSRARKNSSWMHSNGCTRAQEHSVPVLKADRGSGCWPTCMRWCPAARWARRCTTSAAQWPKLVRYVEDGRYPDRQQRLREFDSPVCGRAPQAGSSPTPWPAPTPARTCTRCCRPARPTASTAIATCALFIALPNAKTVDDYEALLPWRLATAER